MPVVFFEAPHRIARTMAQIRSILGERQIIAGRELTKLHETLVEQPISAWLDQNEAGASDKGEHVVVVLPPAPGSAPAAAALDDQSIADEIGRMIENDGLRPKAAARAVAAKYGLSASAAYALHARRKK
jgi:16S rRNA (cytidine1402-2'-O)-methyltransferase